jgi:hypothetical protein
MTKKSSLKKLPNMKWHKKDPILVYSFLRQNRNNNENILNYIGIL